MTDYKNCATFLAIGLVILLTGWRCAFDKAEIEMLECEDDITYENTVKPIIDGTCAYSGCHDGQSEAPGNFTSYNGMLNWLENGLFEQRVIINRDMPPADASGPIDLTQEQIHTLRCWLQDDFPKN